jgi:hypothetical protein
LTEGARFSAQDIVAFFSTLPDAESLCIVGGQALNLWAEYFSD